MKTLRLTILLEPTTSQAELANTFGKLTRMMGAVHRWVQFSFDVRMLTVSQLAPIYNLLLSYEQRHGQLTFKMFHLYDDDDNSASPVSLQAYRGLWAVVSSSTGVELNTSVNLLTIL